MLPVLEGVIARRVLLNFAVDPEVAQRLVPRPLEVAVQRGKAVAGICLIRLEHLRPRGMPAGMGVSSENMAHRIAIRYNSPDGPADGVFIWRRETDRALVALLGGRLFPGVHGRAAFDVSETESQLGYEVRTTGEADVSLRVSRVQQWPGSRLFPSFDEVAGFFQRGDHGYSCSLDGKHLEGMKLRTTKWDMTPLVVEEVHSNFFEEQNQFPPGSVELDGAVLMHGVPHEWHELTDVPELAAHPR